VGSELRASSPDSIHRPRHHGFRLVRAGVTAETPSALTPGGVYTAKDQPVVKPASPSSWRTFALALLAVVVVAQGGTLAYWFVTGRAAAAPESGSLAVASDPSGSPVSVDGVSRGTTPLSVALRPGVHEIGVGAGAQFRSQRVDVKSGGDARIFFELPRGAESTALPIAATGLQVTTEPPAAKVLIDGEASGASAFASGWIAISGVPAQIMENGTLLGSTETPRILVPVGSHELEFTNAALGYRITRTVQVLAGQTSSIILEAPQGTLSINALPWAEVWVDGTPAGETPIGNLSLTIGTHELLFRHPELGEQRKTVTVGAREPVRVGVDLRK
jgi:hypothetical protein